MSGQAALSHGAGEPAIGEVIAQKYRVESVVGRGGMGVVIAARHLQLGQTVAIKLLTLPPDEDRRDEAIGRFLNEAQAAARLRGDHVVRIYDVGQLESGLPFMVMELLNGSDLGSVLDERGALPEAEAVDYVLQACAGVAEAHDMGIVHRDLKPTNLFVTRRSDGLPLLKVLDFGISKQLSDPDSGQALPTFTNTRTLMGSPNYMSPEQIRDARRVDARADIWALGIILQELVTDAPVFRGESFPGVCAAIVADPPMPVRTMRPDVSEKLEAVINRCLEKDVTRRYQSVAELAADLSPLGMRAMTTGTVPQAVVYSSHTRVVAPSRSLPVAPSRAPNDVTVSMPSGPEVTYSESSVRPEVTLESARLNATPGTQTALSAPDSRVEIVTPPPARRSSRSRWLLPAGLALLLAGGLLLLRGRPGRTPANGSAPAASAASRTEAPFTLQIDSDPTGASVSEGSVRLGTTPFSLAISLPEGGSARAFVVEREGYAPYVVRQGPAHGAVHVTAVLSPQKQDTPPAPSAAPAPLAAPAPPVAVKPRPPAVKHPPVITAKPPSDIRLER
jgi:serine/threonine-protein kinase